MRTTWIPISDELWDSAEVRRLAAILQNDNDRVAAKLVRLWLWISNQSGDRHIAGLDQRTIDGLVGLDGFAQGMLAVRLLVRTEHGLVVPHFESHLCLASKARLGDAARKSLSRRRGRGGPPEDGPTRPGDPAADAEDEGSGVRPELRPVHGEDHGADRRGNLRPDICPDARPDKRPDTCPDKGPDARPNCKFRAAMGKDLPEELNCPSNASTRERAAHPVLSPPPERAGVPAALSRQQVKICSLLLEQSHKGEQLLNRQGASGIARHPHATLAQVLWAIGRLREELPSGRIRNPAGYLRDLITKERPPASWMENHQRRQLEDVAALDLHVKAQAAVAGARKGEGG